LRGGDADGVRVLAQRAVVELREIADAVLNARADGERPEHAALSSGGSAGPGPELQLAVACFVGEARNVGVRCARKEEQLVEIALARELCVPQGQAGILGQLARGERTQSHDLDLGVRGERFQSIRGGGQRFRGRNAHEAAKTEGCRGPLRTMSGGVRTHIEIAFGQVDAAAVLGDEGVLVAEAAAGLVELQARAAGEPDGGNAGVVERGGELVESGNALAACGDQRVDGDVENAGGLAQTGLRRCAPL